MRFRSTHPAAAGAGLVLLLAAAAFAQDPPAGEEDFLRPNAVTADHAGESLVVEGRVAEVRRTNAGLHLYFGADMTSAFQVLIPTDRLHLWTGTDPEKRYSRRNLRVTGTVEEEGGRLFITATGTDQIKIVPRRRPRRR